jgi:glycosyltransferase involved in cell wall biosynthesis
VGGAPHVWEFNTVPSYGRYEGASETEIAQAIADFQKQGKGCDLAICVSRAIADLVAEELGITRTVVIPNGSDPDLFRPDAPLNAAMQPHAGRFNVVWLGTGDVGWHDFNTVLEVVRQVKASVDGHSVVFHLIGRATEKLNDPSLEVFGHGPIPYRDLPGWLSGMHIGLIAYHPGVAHYSSPLKFFDYLASGLTVVANPQPQVKELLGTIGQEEQVAPAPEAGYLAEQILILATDRERCRQLGIAGRQLVVDRFTWQHTVEHTMKELEQLLV